jgi:hypothetical protein
VGVLPAGVAVLPAPRLAGLRVSVRLVGVLTAGGV